MENVLIPAMAAKVAEMTVLACPMPRGARTRVISHQDAAAHTVAAL
ncbi:hypothetical protein [Mesobaculum littorinae]|nr:hypothetical protein [Mesobaculum littorinae]